MKFTHLVCSSAAMLITLATLPLEADEQRAKAPGAVNAAGKIDLNTAELKTLAAVPAIGPDLAKAIIAARPFTTMSDLDRLPGLSAERLEQIRATTYISTPPSKSRLGEPTMEKDRLGAPETAKRPAGKLDINTASESALAAHPEIGPDVARAIVAARPFGSLNELDRVRGLTAERLEQIRGALSLTLPDARRTK